MVAYITRGLTGLDTTRSVFTNCFVFAQFKSEGISTYQRVPTFYVFSPSQDAGPLLLALQTLPVDSLGRTVSTGGDLPNHSFQSDVEMGLFGGPYDLRQTGIAPVGVHVGLRRRGPRRRPRGLLSVFGLDQLFEALLRWLQFRNPDDAYSDIRVNVNSGDINNATSLGGWIARFDAPPAWMITKAQSGI